MQWTRRLVLGSLASVAASRALARADTPDAALEAAIAAPNAPPAIAAAILGADGLRWSGVRGLRRQGEAAPATLQDRWHLGSNTKAMTAAVWARLVEQGRARWDMPLSEVFSDWPLDAGFRTATVDDLFRHRAGLTDAEVIGVSWLMTARADPRPLPDQRAALAKQALTRPPTGTVGAFAYGNLNYIVAGAAMERLTGRAWEEVMRAELYAPLGLDSAGFGAPRSGQGDVWGHRRIGERWMAVDPADPGGDNPLALGPAGTAHMSLADYGRWLAALLNDGGGWLTPEKVRRLHDPGSYAGPAYAYGWGVSRPAWAGGQLLAHEGSNTLWHALALVVPERRLAVAVLANGFRPSDGPVQTLGRRLVQLAG